MIIFPVTLIVIINIEKCLTDLSFLNKIKRLITERDVKDKNINGTFKTTIYLGSSAKVSCFGKKYQIPNFRHLIWYHLGKRISSSSDRYRIDKFGTLTIYEASVEDSGEFICRVNSESGTHKFKHDVTVVQIPSKSLHIHFIYAVRLCTPKSEELATHFVQSKVEGQICLQKECKLSFIHSTCYYEQFANPRIKVTVPILLFGIPNGSCDVICSREKQEILKQEIKDKVISVVMRGPRLKIREEPQEISVSYLETDEDSLCNPGFEMKGTVSRSLCIPCTPGHFMEKGYCIPCHMNQYNGKYAASECRSCFGGRVTRSRGTVSEDDCYLADPDVLWILFAILIITVPFTLLCFCWSSIKVLEETAAGKCLNAACRFMTCNCKLFRRKTGKSNETVQHSKTHKKLKSVHQRGDNLKQPLDVIYSGRNPGLSGSFVLPSVRHSTGNDFFYRQQQPSTKNTVPPPPALPTDSMLKQATRSTAYHAVTRDNNPGAKNTDRTEVKEIDRAPVKDAKLLYKSRDDDPQFYSDRFLKNKPMYNAIMKSK